MRPSDRESSSEETTSHDAESSSPSREQQVETNQEAGSSDRSEEVSEEYAPPSERYGDGEEEAGDGALGWDEIRGPVHVKGILVIMVLASKVWHMKMLGLHWLLPRVTGNTDPQEGISGYFYPGDMIGDDEFIVHEGNPSRWIMIGPYIAAVLMLITSVVVVIGVPLGYGEAMLNLVTPGVISLGVPDRWWYFPIFLVVIATVLLTRQAIERGSTWHIVTNRQILHRAHVINTTKQRFDLHEIQNVEDHYPPPERFYGIGHIDFFTAGTGSSEVRFHGVENPGDLIKDIKYYMREAKDRRVRGHMSSEGAQSENSSSRAEHQSRQEQQQSPQSNAESVSSREGVESERQVPQEPDGRESGKQDESVDDPDARDYPWRQHSDGEGDSIEEQVTRQSLQDDMRDINDR